MNYLEIPGALAADVPEVRPLFEDHIAYYDEVLATVFLADLEHWTEENLAARRGSVQAILDWLEHAFVAGDPDTKDVIGTGFIEVLPDRGEPNGDLVEMLGPALRGVAREMGKEG